jgi:hypothetical protein
MSVKCPTPGITLMFKFLTGGLPLESNPPHLPAPILYLLLLVTNYVLNIVIIIISNTFVYESNIFLRTPPLVSGDHSLVPNERLYIILIAEVSCR